MLTLDALAPEHLAAVAELTARLKHDLGKYVSFGARWLPPDAGVDERREALADDLLRTRRGPDGEQDAVEVWEPYRAALHGELPLPVGTTVSIADDPDLQRIREAMVRLAALRDQRGAGQAWTAADIDSGLATCREVSKACRELHRRTTEASRHHG